MRQFRAAIFADIGGIGYWRVGGAGEPRAGRGIVAMLLFFELRHQAA